MLVKLSSDSELSNKAQANGDDILFTASNGTTKLDHEIIYYSTGTLVTWVCIPTLSGSIDTEIYMYYGNSGAANQENATGVWDSNYMGVWHLNQTSGNYPDSTSNNNDGTVNGSPDRNAAGKIGQVSIDINSSSEYVNCGNNSSLNLTNAVTLSAWIYLNALDGSHNPFLNKGDNQYCARVGTTGYFEYFTYDGNWVELESNNTLNLGQWYYCVGRSSSGGQLNNFVNGNLQSQTGTNGIMSSGANVNIGRNSTQTSRWFNGRIEECRISNVARSDDWIETEYNNQNDPSSFYTVAGEEILNSPIINPGETTQTSFGTSHIVNTPTNSEGDVIYIYAGIDDHVDMIAPAGFSQAFQNFKAFNNQATHSLWYKTATGSEPSTYTWTSSISQGSTSISWSVSNDDGINVVSSNNSGQSNTAIAGDATTTVNNCLVLRLVVTEEATLPHGTFSNHTLLDSIENVGEVSISAQYKIQKNAGAVGQAQIPLNSVDDWSGMTVCISPSPTHQPIIFDDITFERSVKGDGSSISIDVGQPGNNRLIIVAFDVEDSHGSNFLRSVTIDGKPFTPQAVADNPDGLGNHQEVHTIHEDTLTSTSGVQNIVFSGGNTNWETHVHVYYGVDSNTPIDSGIEETVVGGTIAVENISSNNGSLIFMGAASGTGESSGAGSITAPLVVREQGATNGQRAYFSTLSGIETSGQTNKTYSLIMQGSNLRETGIVLVFDPAESVFTGVTSYHQMIL